MERIKKVLALFMLNMLSLPYLLKAQDEGTYIDNLNAQDSSYMEEDLLAGSEQVPGSNTTAVIVIVAIAVIAAVIYLILKKKKKTAV